jgi:prolyl-tRNA synthetase
MNDLYTFDTTLDNARQTYQDVQEAYRRIFSRVGVPFYVAEADSGQIGGNMSHEYHYASSAGEDSVFVCKACGYASNKECTASVPSGKKDKLRVEAFDDGGDKLVVVVAKRPINATKLAKITSPELKSMPLQHAKQRAQGGTSTRVILDSTATVDDLALAGALFGHPLAHPMEAAVHGTQAGDECARCHTSESLVHHTAIEVAHTFLLGDTYSSTLNATFHPENDATKTPIQMGCYGIGVSRLLAAVVQAQHDHQGMVWPWSIAPYRCCVVVLNPNRSTNNPVHLLEHETDLLGDAMQVATSLATNVDGLQQDVIVDDRDHVSHGWKIQDARLIGYPWMVVVGRDWLSKKHVELHQRTTGKQWTVPHDQVAHIIQTNGL